MGECFIDTEWPTLSIGDYETAYDSGFLTFESYINTGLLTEMSPNILVNGSLYPNRLKTLEMPNVETIGSSLFGSYTVSVETILAPKLKEVQSVNFNQELLPSLSELYLKEIETIHDYANIGPFLSETYLYYSALAYVGDSGFCNNSTIRSLYLPECSYVGYYGFYNLTALNTLRLPNLTEVSAYAFYSLPSLTELYLDNLTSINRGVFVDLLSLKSLTINASTILSSTFVDVPNLEALYLPECTMIDNGYMMSGSYPTSLYLYTPKLEYATIGLLASYTSSVNLPAISAVLSDANLFYYGMTAGFLNYIGVENALSVNFSTSHLAQYIHLNNRYGYATSDTVLNLQNCSTVEALTNGCDFGIQAVSGQYGLVLKTPNLESLYSYAAYNFGNLLEIDLRNISTLEVGALNRACYGYPSVTQSGSVYNIIYNGGLKLKNIGSIVSIMQGALSGTFNASSITFSNCESFDFLGLDSSRFGLYMSYYSSSRCSITTEDISDWDFDDPRIYTLNLPKLSEIIIDGNRLNTTGLTTYNYISPKSLFKLDTCSQILFYDGSSNYFSCGSRGIINCETLYIPECTNISYSINTDFHSDKMIIQANTIYAPALETMSNVIFKNTYNMTLSNTVLSNGINLYYDIGQSSVISISDSFTGNVVMSAYSSVTDTLLSNIYLPNFSGELDFWYSNSSYMGLSSIVAITLSDNIDKFNMLFNNSTSASIDLYGQSSISFNSGSYISRGNSVYMTFHDCVALTEIDHKEIGYVTSSSIWFSALSFYGITSQPTSLPNLETLNWEIQADSIYIAEDPISVDYMNYIRYVIPCGSEAYMPNLSTINFSYPSELESYISVFHPAIRFYSNVQSITLGFSSLYDLAWLSASDGVEYVYDIGIPETVTYLSLGNLTGIPTGRNALASKHTLYLPNVETLNISNVSYISQYGLYAANSYLDLPNLEYIENHGLWAPNVSYLSVPEVTSIGTNAFYSCSKLTYIDLPNCSYIGLNALPSLATLIKLGYSSVVSMPSITLGSYNSSIDRIVQVPLSLVSSYKADEMWGSILASYNWLIAGY